MLADKDKFLIWTLIENSYKLLTCRYNHIFWYLWSQRCNQPAILNSLASEKFIDNENRFGIGYGKKLSNLLTVTSIKIHFLEYTTGNFSNQAPRSCVKSYKKRAETVT